MISFRGFPRDLADLSGGTVVELRLIGRGRSPGCANIRQALASPYPGRNIHDLAATTDVVVAFAPSVFVKGLTLSRAKE